MVRQAMRAEDLSRWSMKRSSAGVGRTLNNPSRKVMFGHEPGVLFRKYGSDDLRLADDHCPPHVHARHRGEDWISRVGFSYITDTVVPISIAPLKNIPLQRVVNRLLDDIQARLADCRSS
jgi:hypothetical protein